jgi:hypothetical protein
MGNKKAVGGLVFAVGLIVLLIGAMTDVYTTTVGVIAALAIWLIGGALVAMVLGGKGESPKPPTQPQQ